MSQVMGEVCNNFEYFECVSNAHILRLSKWIMVQISQRIPLVLSSMLRISQLSFHRPISWVNSINMQTHQKVKPLKRCRKMFSWFCADVIDKPLNENQMRSRKNFRFMTVVTVVASALIANSSLLMNRFTMDDIGELFIDSYQLVVTVFEIASIIVMIKIGPKLRSLFQNLDKIYDACKALLLIELLFIF